jgi:hypothetical protein
MKHIATTPVASLGATSLRGGIISHRALAAVLAKSAGFRLLLVAITLTFAASRSSAADRIGVYDSRIVAYAAFHTPEHQNALNATISALHAAKAAGNEAEIARLDKVLADEQTRSHRQVFSTDPIPDVLAQIQDRLPAIQKQAGAVALVSKWDKSALRQYRKANQIDVTDRLAAEFKPGEKQLKVIEELKRAKPVSPRAAEKHNH